MEMEPRGFDGMDLLKDITRELRGRGETRRDERLQTTNSRRDTDRRGSTGDADESPDENADAESPDQSRGDEHVCSFCETEFEATRGSCPDCDAKIVFRGER